MKMHQHKVGNKLWVWTTSPQDGASRTGCLITAHGAQSLVNDMSRTPNCSLAFYCDHGHIQFEPGLDAIITKTVIPSHKIRSASSQDYVLSKFLRTNSTSQLHGDLTTYQDVRDLPTQLSERVRQAKVQLADPACGETRKDEAAHVISHYDRPEWMDIVSIRYRPDDSPVTLSWVLNELGQHSYFYTEVHCDFCRGPGKAQKAINAPVPHRAYRGTATII